MATTTAFAQYRFDHWTADMGLPQNIITTIHQTRDGYLWVATLDGLARFDGVRFTVFNKSNSPGINSNRFIALYEDRDGDLWASTENGGLTRYHDGAFTTYTTQHGLPHNFIRGITGDESGNLWVLSAEQIMRWDQGRFVPAGLPGLKVDFQNSDWDNKVFLGADKTNLYRFTQGRLTTWPLPRDLLGRSNNRFAEDSTGAIWMLTLDGKAARIKDGKALNVFRMDEAQPDQGAVMRAEMGGADQDRQGNPWTIRVGKELT
ncbi:MAG: ligand-binding sensor domain-containing protein, partial [Dongiaceae bacterium]